jgi:ribose-phosphate diphosphokinase
MITHGNEIKLFSGNSNRPLAEAIAAKLNTELGGIEVATFSDGEINVHIEETVRGRDLFIIQSTSSPVNDNLMELLIMIDAAKRASAGRITAVIPYFGYARQDRKARSRDPITAKLVANLITAAGADRVLTMDLHAEQIQGFFDIPVDNLLGGPTLYNHFAREGNIDVVVSPDVGSVKRARKVAEKFGVPIAIIDKRRPKANVMEVMNIIGDVRGKKCLMIDDMIDTAGTICQGAQALKDAGATEIYAACTHAVLSGPAVERLEKSAITKLVMLDTVHLPEEKMRDKFSILTTADIFAAAIENVYLDKPMSKLYD